MTCQAATLSEFEIDLSRKAKLVCISISVYVFLSQLSGARRERGRQGL